MEASRVQANLSIYAVFLMFITLTLFPDGTISAPPIKKQLNTAPKSFFAEMFAYTKSNESQCFFPLNEKDVTMKSPFMDKMDRLCHVVDGKSERPKGQKICILISDMMFEICNKTKNYQLRDDLKAVLKNSNFSIERIVQEQKESSPDSFCKAFLENENVPKSSEIRPEMQSFYANFLVQTQSEAGKSDGDNKEHCLNVCKNTPEAGDIAGDSDFKINPICLFFNSTSFIWKKLQTLPQVATGVIGKISPEKGQKEEVGNVGILDSEIAAVSKKAEKTPLETEGQMEDDNQGVQKDDPAIGSDGSKLNNLKEKEDTKSEMAGSVSGKPLLASSMKNDDQKPASSLKISTPSSSDAEVNPDNMPPPLKKEDKVDTDDKSKASSPAIPKVDEIDENVVGIKAEPNADEKDSDKDPKVDKEKDKDNAPLQPGNEDYDDSVPPGFDGSVGEGSEDKPIDNKYNSASEPIKKSQPPAPAPAEKNTDTQDVPNLKQTFIYNQPNVDDESGGYFNYFLFFLSIVGLCFLAFHNKRRFMAYIVEGRKPRGSRSRRRSTSASGTSYRRLENNFE